MTVTIRLRTSDDARLLNAADADDLDSAIVPASAR